MKLTRITPEQLKNDPRSEYNKAVWNQRMKDYEPLNPQYYIVKGNGFERYEYDRHFVEYDMPGHNYRVISSFGVSTMLAGSYWNGIKIDKETGEITSFNFSLPNDNETRKALNILAKLVPDTIFTTIAF